MTAVDTDSMDMYVHGIDELVCRHANGGTSRLALPDRTGITLGYWIKPSPFPGTPPWEWVITNMPVDLVTGMTAGYTHSYECAASKVCEALNFWAALGYAVVEIGYTEG